MAILPRLEELRKQKKLSQAQFARAINMQQQQYSRYETGKREPQIKHIKKICRTFEVSADWLLGLDLEDEEDIIIEEGEE